MIYLTLGGGLGNQMFQYAFAKSIAKETNQKVSFNLYHIERDAIRNMSINNLSCDYMVCGRLKGYLIGVKIKLFGKISRKFSKKKFGRLREQGYYIESEVYRYEPLKKELLNKKNYYIEGGFQTPLYFDHIRGELLKEFRVSSGSSKENLEMLNRIKSTNSVCLHIRRGDYLNFSNLNICSYDYYLEGMKYIKNNVKNPVYFVFSTSHEDIVWIKEHYDFDAYDVVFVDLNNPDYEEIRLMYNCNHFIISNSTFSWWAQYLSEYNDKIVVAPSIWNRNEGNTEINIYQSNWKVIPVMKEF